MYRNFVFLLTVAKKIRTVKDVCVIVVECRTTLWNSHRWVSLTALSKQWNVYGLVQRVRLQMSSWI